MLSLVSSSVGQFTSVLRLSALISGVEKYEMTGRYRKVEIKTMIIILFLIHLAVMIFNYTIFKPKSQMLYCINVAAMNFPSVKNTSFGLFEV